MTLTSASLAGATISSRIAYVDPQIAPDSRTARVRVEVPNPGARLLLGMLMEMRIETSAGEVILVPKTSIQTIGDAAVVYIADASHRGTYVERTVRLGDASGDVVEIVAGVSAGESVVTSGSFLVRSERDRTHPGPARPLPGGAPVSPQPAGPPAGSGPQVFDVTVTANGFAPAEISVPAGVPLRLRFTRQAEKTCATDVVFPALKISRALPLGTPVVIDLPAQSPGRLSFACGMNMYKGQVVVR